jgi:hypothetical protein
MFISSLHPSSTTPLVALACLSVQYQGTTSRNPSGKALLFQDVVADEQARRLVLLLCYILFVQETLNLTATMTPARRARGGAFG